MGKEQTISEADPDDEQDPTPTDTKSVKDLFAELEATFAANREKEIAEEADEDEEEPSEDEEEEADETAEDEPAPDESDPVEEEKKKYEDQIAELRQKVADLETRTAAPPKEEQPPAPPPPSLEQLLPDEKAFDAILENRENLVGFLSQFAQSIREMVLRDLPVVVNQTVTRQASLKQTVEDFYVKNPELRPFMRFVGFTVSQVQSEHADWPIDRVLVEAANRSRRELKLSKVAEDAEDARRKGQESGKPGFAKKPRGQRGTTDAKHATSDSQQIADMLKSLNR